MQYYFLAYSNCCVHIGRLWSFRNWQWNSARPWITVRHCTIEGGASFGTFVRLGGVLGLSRPRLRGGRSRQFVARPGATYRQNQTRAPNAAHNHAPAARNGLMIVWPSRSHANADKEKAMPVRPVRISTHIALAVGSCANRSSITVSNINAARCF